MQEIEDNKEATKLVDLIKLDDNLITINKTQYRVVENHDGGFNKERIEERYNNVLEKYDFIVGDWGYDQLRFKGFYEDERQESTLDNRISHLEDYLLEYCNFGCAYFVLEKVKKAPLKRHHRKSTNRVTHNSTHNHKFKTRTTGKKAEQHKPKQVRNKQHKNNKVSKRHVPTKKTTSSTKKAFKIRKIGE
ncbi:YutD family protein [Companilactobacillus sp. FL22-1]|uniref:YutD family protein n=1 Tax=Companilactobacillus sp. FL22-1 TaxID=3373892 RepID=UPI00375503B7